MYDGRWYGMPQAGGSFADRAIFYNKDLIDASGLSAPTAQWTWNTFATYMQKLSVDKNGDGTNDQVGFTFSNLEWPIFVWSGGGEIFNDARNKFTLKEQAAVNAIEFWANMTRKNVVGYPNGDFAGGKTAMRTGAYYETRTLGDKGLGFDWSVVEFPKGPAGSVNRRATHPWVVPSGAQYPKEGWEFIKFWLTDLVQSDLVLKWNWRPPVTASIAKQLARMKVDKAPYTYAPFMGINSTSKSLPIDVPNWDQIAPLLDKSFVPVWKGEQSALAAMSAVESQVMSIAKEK
jgi:maltose-binding protein MalE